MVNRRAIGSEAEKQAEIYLLAKGYTIVARNWRCRSGEIDLIMRDKDVLVFVEVRSRTGTTRYGMAVESVNYRKQRQVRATAEVYLYQQGNAPTQVRFDVVTVLFQPDVSGKQMEISHWMNAF
ncbi:YraN family protein [Paenibacillus selenitireducens]|uniref:UPF0102 protein BVG16_14080 n=1 Tax=Paenibacillus selenitireducens TaxID=1324314 RepID=A0A1T2XCF1_9BACL|nr:YraN family protein [Paenibacillus selenitireducens]OPA77571.1 YraN family protein [Paenibacillus selenitireducens]